MPRNLFLLYMSTMQKSLGNKVCSRILVLMLFQLSTATLYGQPDEYDYDNYQYEPYLRLYENQRYENDFYNGRYRQNNALNGIDLELLNDHDQVGENPNKNGNELLHGSFRITSETKITEPEISANSIDLPDVPDVHISNPFLLILLLLIGIVLYAKFK